MYQTVNVFYRSIILTQGDKQTLTYQGRGILLKKGNNYHLDFKVEEHHFHIVYGKDEVTLQNHQQVLRLHRHCLKENLYPTDFGMLKLKTKLLKLDGHQEHLHLVYELYEGLNMISKVFIKIQYTPVDEEA